MSFLKKFTFINNFFFLMCREGMEWSNRGWRNKMKLEGKLVTMNFMKFLFAR